MVLHPSSDFFFSAIQCCQWRKAKCFQSFVLACQSFLSCVQQTNENVFCEKSTNAFALQHLTSKTERVLGTTKRRRLLLYALYLAQPNKKLCFFFYIEFRQVEFGHFRNPQLKIWILRIWTGKGIHLTGENTCKFGVFSRQELILTLYDENEKCRECNSES